MTYHPCVADGTMRKTVKGVTRIDIQKVGRSELQQNEKKKSGPEPSLSFTEIMNKQKDEKAHERFTKLVQQIENQGNVLVETRTVEELRKYKLLVKEFMQEAVEHGLRLEEKRGFNRRGRTKIYKTVQEVDQKLLDLTNAVLEKNKKSLDILDLVGEVRGLLVNVYT